MPATWLLSTAAFLTGVYTSDGHPPESAVLMRKIRQLMETAMVIDVGENESCPQVIAPVDVGADIALGRMFGFEGFLRGYTPKRGRFGTSAKGRLGWHNVNMNLGGWNRSVQNRATGCVP